eukprot:764097-Hanusia_phi.AAC.2
MYYLLLDSSPISFLIRLLLLHFFPFLFSFHPSPLASPCSLILFLPPFLVSNLLSHLFSLSPLPLPPACPRAHFFFRSSPPTAISTPLANNPSRLDERNEKTSAPLPLSSPRRHVCSTGSFLPPPVLGHEDVARARITYLHIKQPLGLFVLNVFPPLPGIPLLLQSSRTPCFLHLLLRLLHLLLFLAVPRDRLPALAVSLKDLRVVHVPMPPGLPVLEPVVQPGASWGRRL